MGKRRKSRLGFLNPNKVGQINSFKHYNDFFQKQRVSNFENQFLKPLIQNKNKLGYINFINSLFMRQIFVAYKH